MQGLGGGGSPGEHDNIYALMEAQALARGETTVQNLPDGRVMRTVKGFLWSLVAIAIVGGGTWLASGSTSTAVVAAIATVIALVLLVAWRAIRSRGGATDASG